MASGEPVRLGGVRALVAGVVVSLVVAACAAGKSGAPTTTIPVTDSTAVTTSTTVLDTTTSSTTTTTVVATTTTTVAITPGSKYTIKKGDSLNSIAAAAGVTVAQIVAANNIKDPNKIYVGQVIKIPLPSASGSTTTAKATTTTTASGTGKTYTVKAGDTLAAIAGKFNVTLTALEQANNITDPNKIYVGQVLKIP